MCGCHNQECKFVPKTVAENLVSSCCCGDEGQGGFIMPQAPEFVPTVVNPPLDAQAEGFLMVAGRYPYNL